MKNNLKTFFLYLAFLISSHYSFSQYTSGGFGGFSVMLMKFGNAGIGAAYGGMGGAVFAENGYLGGFGYGGAATKDNRTVAIGYGGLMGGIITSVTPRQKIAPGLRIGFGGFVNVEENPLDNSKITTSDNLLRLDPNVMYLYELLQNFKLQITAGYSLNLIGNQRDFNSAFFSVGFVLGSL
ncbi:hypothetical protein AT05_00750 [Schleiferia thermophila str. Yellowstone]|uniref:hypothetical protein n=1 Tax=Schleiferia thermophila TaxID=884107 RepID=UPI0004E61305|nr:hypothetical protein [Schleiferia thermophila]KFD40251.1 hypothetical protein AT05_00750 [Schleiferia thermophila str. Yellowstone]